jgi:hypothetical protein
MSPLARILFPFVFSALLLCISDEIAASAQAQNKTPSIPGYETQKMDGFTLFIHPDAKKHEDEFKKSPMEVLKLELKMLGQILNKRALAKVQTLPFWVEWDEAPEGTNTGGATVIAYYLSADLRMARIRGEHPLRARTITICNLKTLTRLHQPEIDSGKCILLHEVAHAVHDQIIGFDNPDINLAFTQAMNRKLYQPGLYMTSSAREFFAELTCSYLDRLDHFPRNRGDLKKHDPATFKLLERIWSSSASAESAKSTTGTKKDPQLQELAALNLKGTEPGTTVQRNAPSFTNRKGNLLALAFWLDSQPSTLQDLDRLKYLQARLPEMGIDMLLVSPADSSPRTSARVLKDRGITLPACSGLSGEVAVGPIRPPVLIVFDAQGKAIYKGPDFASESLLRRLAMSSRLEEALADAGPTETINKEGPEKSMTPKERPEWASVRTNIKRGDDQPSVMRLVAQYTKSPDDDLARQAKKVMSLWEKPITKRLEELEKDTEDAPAEVYGELNRIAGFYKNLDVGNQAKDLAEEIKGNPDVQMEIKAQVHLDLIRKAKGVLDRIQTAGGILPPQATNQLLVLQNNLKILEDKYPNSPSTLEAKSIVRKYIPAGMTITNTPNRPPGR